MTLRIKSDLGNIINNKILKKNPDLLKLLLSKSARKNLKKSRSNLEQAKSTLNNIENVGTKDDLRQVQNNIEKGNITLVQDHYKEVNKTRSEEFYYMRWISPDIDRVYSVRIQPV